jgi:hypothetical protein
MNRNLHRASLRFARTLDEAFNTPRYACAVEYYASNRLRDRFCRACIAGWRRVLRFFGGM